MRVLVSIVWLVVLVVGEEKRLFKNTLKPHRPCVIEDNVKDVIGESAICMRLLKVGFGGYSFTQRFTTNRLGSGYCDTFLPLPSCCIEECRWAKRCKDGEFVADLEDGKRNPKVLCCITKSHEISRTECQWFEIKRKRTDDDKYIKIDKDIKNFHNLNEEAFLTKLIIEDKRPRKLTARVELCNATLDADSECIARHVLDRTLATSIGLPVGLAVPLGIVVGIFGGPTCPELTIVPFDHSVITAALFRCVSYTPVSPVATGNSEGDTVTIPITADCVDDVNAGGPVSIGSGKDVAYWAPILTSADPPQTYSADLVFTCTNGAWTPSSWIVASGEIVAPESVLSYICFVC